MGKKIPNTAASGVALVEQERVLSNVKIVFKHLTTAFAEMI